MADVVLHPATIMRALEAEADAWAQRTDMAALISRLSTDPRAQAKMMQFAKQCFVEGAYEGAIKAARGDILVTVPLSP